MSDQIFELQRLDAEATNRHCRPVQRQRRNDRVDAASVAQSRIDHRADLVDAAADLRDDAVDDLPQVRIVAEAHFRALQPPATLDVNPVVAVHQDVRDGHVLEERFQRPQAEGLVHDVVHELFLLGGRQQTLLALTQLTNEDADFGADGVGRQRLEVLHIQPLDQLLVDAHPQLLHVLGALTKRRGLGDDRRLGDSRRRRRGGRTDIGAVLPQFRRGRRNRCLALREQTHLQTLSTSTSAI